MNNKCIIAGSGGIVGSTLVRKLADRFSMIIGIDNDLNKLNYGEEESVLKNYKQLMVDIPNYEHERLDIRNRWKLEQDVFQQRKYNDVALVINAVSQSKADFAAKEPILDFNINVVGNLNLLDLTNQYYPDAKYILLTIETTGVHFANKMSARLITLAYQEQYELNTKIIEFRDFNEGVLNEIFI